MTEVEDGREERGGRVGNGGGVFVWRRGRSSVIGDSSASRAVRYNGASGSISFSASVSNSLGGIHSSSSEGVEELVPDVDRVS